MSVCHHLFAKGIQLGHWGPNAWGTALLHIPSEAGTVPVPPDQRSVAEQPLQAAQSAKSPRSTWFVLKSEKTVCAVLTAALPVFSPAFNISFFS